MSIPIWEQSGYLGVDRRSPVPLYHQIKEAMLSLIVSGDLASKDRIPSERELQDIFNVSRMTVRRALNELAEEGYLYREQ